MKRHSLTQAQNSDTMPVYGFIIDRGAGIARFLGNDCARGLVLSEVTDLSHIIEALHPLAVPLGDLHADPANANVHEERGIRAIMSSYARYGQRKPIVVNTNGNIVEAGNGQLEAARGLGWTHIAAVFVEDDPVTHAGFAIADNRTAELSAWDDEALHALIEQVMQADEDEPLSDMWDELELEALLREFGESAPDDPGAQIDRAEELNEKWQVQPGDLWEIPSQATPGKAHRILCGDSTNAEDVERLMGGEKADAVVTDPPYGIKRDKFFGGCVGFNGEGKPISRRMYTDEWDKARPSREAFETMLNTGNVIIIFGGNFFTDLLPVGGHWIVWDKHNTMPTFGDCELAWTNIDRTSVKKYDIVYNGLIGKEQDRFHPTQKPAKLFEDIFTDYTHPAQNILDPFLGSGTTLVACERTGRVGYGIELEPKYCAVALERLAGLGLEPERVEQ